MSAHLQMLTDAELAGWVCLEELLAAVVPGHWSRWSREHLKRVAEEHARRMWHCGAAIAIDERGRLHARPDHPEVLRWQRRINANSRTRRPDDQWYTIPDLRWSP
jgi:hypothetical protein